MISWISGIATIRDSRNKLGVLQKTMLVSRHTGTVCKKIALLNLLNIVRRGSKDVQTRGQLGNLCGEG